MDYFKKSLYRFYILLIHSPMPFTALTFTIVGRRFQQDSHLFPQLAQRRFRNVSLSFHLLQPHQLDFT